MMMSSMNWLKLNDDGSLMAYKKKKKLAATTTAI